MHKSFKFACSPSITANEKVFAMTGYSLKVQPKQMLYRKYFAEDNFCSLIINVKPESKLNKDLLPIAPTSSPAIANTHVSSSFIIGIKCMSMP